MKSERWKAAHLTAMQARSVKAGWTQERLDLLRGLWDEGLSGSQIAFRMGLSRSAVLGKVNRIGLPPRRDKVLSPEERLQRRRDQNRRNWLARKKVVKFDPKRSIWNNIRSRPVVDLPPEYSPDAVPFLERRSFQCAWPLWNDTTPIDERTCCGSRSVEGLLPK